MPYSSEVYSSARRIIDERRTVADRDASIRKAGVYARYPVIRELDNQLMREMANLTVLMLREQSDLAVVSRLCDPVDCSLPGSSVHGILQAGVLEWVAISFSSK